MASKKISSLILLVGGEGFNSLGGRRFNFKFDFGFRHGWSCCSSSCWRRWDWVFQLYPLVWRLHAIQTKVASQSSKIYENKSFKPDWKIVPFDKGFAGEGTANGVES